MRIETDPLGPYEVPAGRLFGVQTARAKHNFPTGGAPLGRMRELVRALGWVKKAAAEIHADLGCLAPPVAAAIATACDEVIEGRWDAEFVIDVFQGGAGTSSNMNANEVIANRAIQLLGGAPGEYEKVSPNDHVNKSQSTNDAYATAARLAIHILTERLADAVLMLSDGLAAKARAVGPVAKLGRTQLQDAVPMRADEELDAYAAVLRADAARLRASAGELLEVNLGGTAVGNQLGTAPGYVERALPALARISGLPVRPSSDRFAASWDMGGFVGASAATKRAAVTLSKLASDLRLLSSGPRGGIGEYRLPERQPGSSLMPGKVNPVIPELLNQVCYRAFGADVTVAHAAEAGQLQLNAMEPVIVWTLYETLELLTAAVRTFHDLCVCGLAVDAQVCRNHLDRSTAGATELVATIGYRRAAELARRALETGAPLKDLVSEATL